MKKITPGAVCRVQASLFFLSLSPLMHTSVSSSVSAETQKNIVVSEPKLSMSHLVDNFFAADENRSFLYEIIKIQKLAKHVLHECGALTSSEEFVLTQKSENNDDKNQKIYYEILGVSYQAPYSEIKASYEKLVQALEFSQEKRNNIEKAFEILRKQELLSAECLKRNRELLFENRLSFTQMLHEKKMLLLPAFTEVVAENKTFASSEEKDVVEKPIMIEFLEQHHLDPDFFIKRIDSLPVLKRISLELSVLSQVIVDSLSAKTRAEFNTWLRGHIHSKRQMHQG